MNFYVKPSIAAMLRNPEKIPCVIISDSKWYNITSEDYTYLQKLVGRLEALPYNSLKETEKYKYSAMLHTAERVARCSVPHVKKTRG